MKVSSKKLRESARGMDCALRIPGACNHNPETTVLAHLPCGHKGVGMKSPDNMAVFACSSARILRFGWAPTSCLTMAPSLSRIIVGIERTPYC